MTEALDSLNEWNKHGVSQKIYFSSCSSMGKVKYGRSCPFRNQTILIYNIRISWRRNKWD